MSSDTFTRDKLRWIEQVATDGDLTPLARVVAALIGTRYLNRETGDAWPSIDTLAFDVGLKSTNPVRSSLRSLASNGHLRIQWSAGGKGQTSRFKPVLKPFTDMKGNGGEPFTDMKGMEAKPFTAVNPSNRQTLHGGEPNPSFSEPKPFTDLKGNPLKEPSEEPNEGFSLSPSDATSRKKAQEDGPEFEEFWLNYPRKVDKAAARRAWKTARKKADAATIMAGCLRYAAERDGQDHKFTKYPATWLNADAWENEPAPAPYAGGQSSHGHGRQSAVDIIAQKWRGQL